jgi:hypothetical protein
LAAAKEPRLLTAMEPRLAAAMECLSEGGSRRISAWRDADSFEIG